MAQNIGNRLASTRASLTRLVIVVVAGCALAAPGTAAAEPGSWPWPVAGQVIRQFQNGDDPYAAGMHRGVDVAARAGTTVVAAVAGKVTFAGSIPGQGFVVTERSDDEKHLVSYLYLASSKLVKGSHVSARQAVGSLGTAGATNGVAVHLHLGVRLVASGAYIDPLSLLAPITPTVQHPAPAIDLPAANSMPSAAPPVVKSERLTQHSSGSGRNAHQGHGNARTRRTGREHLPSTNSLRGLQGIQTGQSPQDLGRRSSTQLKNSGESRVMRANRSRLADGLDHLSESETAAQVGRPQVFATRDLAASKNRPGWPVLVDALALIGLSAIAIGVIRSRRKDRPPTPPANDSAELADVLPIAAVRDHDRIAAHK